MNRYEKINNIENLQKLEKSLTKLLNEAKDNLQKALVSELPILICTMETEEDIHFVYYLGDLDRIRVTDELLPNTLDFQSKLNCQYNMGEVAHTQEYLNSLINEIINKNDVHNWIEVSILLAKRIEEKETNKKHR